MTTLQSMASDGRYVKTNSSGFLWHPLKLEQSLACSAVEERLASSTPSNPTLLEWSARVAAGPPQDWYDETTDPFEA